MLESSYQSNVIRYLEQQGYYVVRISAACPGGMPDLLVILSCGKTIWIEMKSVDTQGKSSKKQVKRHRELRALGQIVIVANSFFQAIRQFEKEVRYVEKLSRSCS